MTARLSRREALTSGAAAGALLALGLPEWLLPALAQGETLVPFTDIPDNFTTSPTAEVRILDIRRIDGPFTPRDEFFTVQHYGQPDVDPATYRLKVTGLVDRALELDVEELRRLGTTELVAGFECSGNGPARVQGLVSNGRWTGMFSSLKPGETWGLATVGIRGIEASEIATYLWDRHRIIVAGIAAGQLPGPQFDYQGVRVTPNIYTSIDEVDAFAAAMEELVRQ